MSSLILTVGRDYRAHGVYEYVLSTPAPGDDNWSIVARQGWFRSSTQARQAGVKRAAEITSGFDADAAGAFDACDHPGIRAETRKRLFGLD